MKHDTCTHPRTPAGRAACRKGNAGTSQPSAQATTRVRRASRRAPRVNVPAALTGLRDDALAKGFECSTRTGYDITTHMLDIKAPAGVLTIAWLDTDEGTVVITFRPEGTSVATRQDNIKKGWKLLCSETV